jgi:transcription antitermination factor NusG
VGDGAELYPTVPFGFVNMTLTNSGRVEVASTQWPIASVKPQWCVAYTSANHEKRVTEQLVQRSVEHFLPTYESVRRWKDRRTKLHLPLFPGYVFVCLPVCDRIKVLQVPGVACLVGFNGQPAVVADQEIEALRSSIAPHLGVQPHPYLKVGHRVKIRRGILAGVEGILVRRKNALRVVLSIDLIMRSVSIEVDASDLE